MFFFLFLAPALETDSQPPEEVKRLPPVPARGIFVLGVEVTVGGGGVVVGEVSKGGKQEIHPSNRLKYLFP